MSDSVVPAPAEVEAIWGRETALQAQLCVSVDESYARALTVARQWFEEGFARLGGRFREVALASAPADLEVMSRISGHVPGAVSVRLLSMLSSDDRAGYMTYSPQSWEELLLSLGRVPDLAALELAANDDTGDSLAGPHLDFVVSRVGDGGGTWLVLAVKGSRHVLGSAAQREALLGFLRGVAERGNPVHGEVAWGREVRLGLYESAMGSGPAETLPKGRCRLRGYSWVTILPEEIGRRLGGLDALRGSGAFVEVGHLAAGGYWCRATQTPEDYDQAAAERVFDVVAAALPPGRPNLWRVVPPNVLSPRDPAST